MASVLEERTSRHCLFVPWRRLALYLALRTLAVARKAHPDVPLDDDVIPFVVLAGALRPVIAPVRPTAAPSTRRRYPTPPGRA